MNMAKLGTVSAGAIRPPKLTKPNNGGAYRVTSYTLCDKSGTATRNGWRYGFAFYISAISRRSPSFTSPPMTSDRSEARTRRNRALRIRPKVAVLVPLQLILTTERNRNRLKTPQPPYGAWASRLKNRDINCSSFVTFVTPSCGSAFLIAGGCHG